MGKSRLRRMRGRSSASMQNSKENCEPLLLHTCCTDCALKAFHSLQAKFSEITLYFDNSNIHPRSEWLARLETVKQIAKQEKLELIVADWSPKKWFAAIGEKRDGAGIERCKRCWEMRLNGTVEKCRELGITSFSTTLLSSKYQNREMITETGKKLAGKDLNFVEFKTSGTCPNSKGFYMQNYCGCVYSLKERMEGKSS